MNEMKYKVKNMCPYDIGIFLQNGQAPVIKAGSFILLNADEIMYAESLCAAQKVFASRMLVAFNEKNEEVPLDQLGMWIEESTVVHNTEEEIKKLMKGAPKKIEAWIEEINTPEELYHICSVAKKMDDLPQSKIAILRKKNPDFDWEE